MDTTETQNKIDHIKAWLGTGSINIFGYPFAGKDTHGRELAEIFEAALIGGGDIIRSSAPQHMKDHIAQGELSPTDEYLSLVLPYFSQTALSDKPLVLSSVGRWFGEHIPVEQAAKEAKHPIKAVLFLDITTDELRKRWEASLQKQDRGARHDDAEHILETRINEFDTKTRPVIEYYQQKGVLLDIPGNGTKRQTLRKIIDSLYQQSL